MTHDMDPLLTPATIPGSFSVRRESSFDLPEWMKEVLIATEAVQPTRYCPHLHSGGPQTVVRRVEYPEEALCLLCHKAFAGYRACALCGVKVRAGSLEEWRARDAEIPMPGTAYSVRFSASRCRACWKAAEAPNIP
ncbi:hypothetical protein OG756_41855 (plasmid) [Streptomyces sp. NBC_01310]|uniref:hypothetical protein n=1 Tax=Streptomyces sp. NBC_01310 TaxID=2903820 RepID=UPI0035B6281E|nr:hypothetical protein OG756_41855 [Streptomyces sp. NBC_01310]